MKHQTRNISRRHFLAGATATAFGACSSPQIVPSSALGRAGNVAPSGRITLGFIGTGSHGISRNLARFLPEPDAQVLAVCDVDRSRREDAKRRVEELYMETHEQGSYKGCATYNDFRDLIARNDIDAVMISTPDHWHVIPAVMAAEAGKDVMCEKPLTLTVQEGRILSNTVERCQRVFQTASENRSVDVYHRLCELVRNGRVGKIHTIRVGLPAGHPGPEASHEIAPVPKGFDYDMWLGQAPYAPYCPARCHFNFRWILDYSGGLLTDWGAHLIDLAQWGNNTERTGPLEVEGQGDFPTEGLYNTAKEYRVTYRYANGVKLIVTSSGPSIRFEGSEGWVGIDGWRGKLEADPVSVLESVIPRGGTSLYTCEKGEQRNFLDCVKSRKACYAPAEIGHRTITIAHIGNISMMLKRRLRWNPDQERFVNDGKANAMLSREMRKPWKL